MMAENLFKRLLAPVLVLISVGSLVPSVLSDRIDRGQVSKQTFVCEMARSYTLGERAGIFPIRHFLEIEHPGPVAWAEELPLYVLGIAGLHRATGIPIEVAGKVISFASFFFLLGASFLIAPSGFGWLSVLIFSLIPVFRIYAMTVLPEMAMVAAVAWGLVFSLKGFWKRAILCLGIATAFKYYALFSFLGVGLFYFFSAPKVLLQKKHSWIDALVLVALAFLVLAPTLGYLIYFLTQGIANPITEYRHLSGVGHLSSWAMLTSPKFYQRMITWIFVKNPTLAGGVLALPGFWWMAKKSKPMCSLVGWLLLSGCIFALVFSTSFYVHDYYGIQIALPLALGLVFFFSHLWESRKPLLWGVALTAGVGFTVLSVARVKSATMPQNYYGAAAQILSLRTEMGEPGVLFLDTYAELSLYLSRRTAWMVSLEKLQQFPALDVKVDELLDRPEVRWVSIFLTDRTDPARREAALSRVKQHGWVLFDGPFYFPSQNEKEPNSWFTLFRRD